MYEAIKSDVEYTKDKMLQFVNGAFLDCVEYLTHESETQGVKEALRLEKEMQNILGVSCDVEINGN